MLKSRTRRLFIAILLAVGFLLATMALGVQDAVAGGGLPPRPEPTPIPAAPSNPVSGATIQLHASASLPGAWTAVEWQNEHGQWYEVDGWHGHLDEGHADTKSWWVVPTNFGEGPFRWLIYSEEGGSIVVVSEPFTLPTANKQLLIVEVTLPADVSVR